MDKKVLLVQPGIQPPGGGNGVAAWMIEALKDRCELHVLTLDPLDPGPVDRFFGTSLGSGGFVALRPGRALLTALHALPVSGGLVRSLALMATARAMASRYHLLVTANNESDLGRPGIQYVHFPRFRFPRPASDMKWYHACPEVLRGYYHAAMALTGYRGARMRRNLFLANSAWTAAKLRALYPDADIETLHPPVAGPFTPAPDETREEGFVCVGRISPEKRIDLVLRILERVRERRPGIHLHILGTADDEGYSRLIRELASARRAWVTLEEGLDRRALLARLGTHRFGIHGMEEEHFGMGVAEMVRSGMVVFVPDGGGQREIVGACDRLLYRSEDDAVAKILAVTGSRDLRRSLANYLQGRARLFDVEIFRRRLNELVELASRD